MMEHDQLYLNEKMSTQLDLQTTHNSYHNQQSRPKSGTPYFSHQRKKKAASSGKRCKQKQLKVVPRCVFCSLQHINSQDAIDYGMVQIFARTFIKRFLKFLLQNKNSKGESSQRVTTEFEGKNRHFKPRTHLRNLGCLPFYWKQPK